MAYSWIDLEPSAGTQNLTIGVPYLSRDHLHVYRTLDGDTTETTEFDFLTSYTIRLHEGAEEGEVIRIRRITPITGPLIDYVNGSTLQESELDTQYAHLVYVMQERIDVEGTTLALNDTLQWDFQGRESTGLVFPGQPVQRNGAGGITRETLNFVDSPTVTFAIADNAAQNRVDVTAHSNTLVFSTTNNTSITNSSALTTLTTLTIPAGKMGLNSRLTLDTLLTFQNNSFATRYLELSVWIGSNRIGMHQFSFTHDGSDLYGIRVSAAIENLSSFTSQTFWSTAVIRRGPQQSAGDELGGGLLSVDTASEFAIVVKGELLAGNATQILTHRGTKAVLL